MSVSPTAGALFQGVATNLGPVPLSSLASTSTVAVSDLPEYYRETVTKTFTVRDTAEADQRIAELGAIADACRLRLDQTTPCTIQIPTAAVLLPTQTWTDIPTSSASGTTLPSASRGACPPREPAPPPRDKADLGPDGTAVITTVQARRRRPGARPSCCSSSSRWGSP